MPALLSRRIIVDAYTRMAGNLALIEWEVVPGQTAELLRLDHFGRIYGGRLMRS